MIKPTKPQVQRTHEEIFAENMKRFESVKNASELNSAFGYVSICGVWKSFVTEEDKKAYAQAYMDAYNRIKARYESNDWEWKLVVPEIVKAFFAQEKVAENDTTEKDLSGKAFLTLPQIAKLEKKGFNRWQKGDFDRLYIKAWDVDGLDAHWKENGESLSYTKSAAVSHSKIYIDVKSGEVVVQCEDAYYGNQICGVVKEIANALCLSVSTVYRRIKARGVKLERGINANDIAKIL